MPSFAVLLEALESRVMLSAAGDLLFSLVPARSLAGVGQVSTSDIVSYDLSSADGEPRYEVFFDGDDVGLSGVTIDAFALLGETEVLLSFASNTTVDGIGPVAMSDVVRFTVETLGSDTAGSFSLYLDGTSVGLDVSDSRHRNIDALSVLENGHLLISIEGSTTVTANGVSLAVTEADVLELAPSSSGPISSGSWTTFLRGSDAGLTVATEDVDGVHVTADGRLLVSTVGSFFVNRNDGGGSFGGSNNDVVEFLPDAGNGAGFAFPIFFDGSIRDPALLGANLSAFDLLLDESASNTPPVAHGQDVRVAEDEALSIALSGDDGDPEVEQPLTYVIIDGPQHGTLTGFDPITGIVSYTPADNFNGQDAFTFLIEDDASIDGTPLRSEPVTVRISVTAVNDAPVVNGPGQKLVGNTNQPLSILGIAVSDIDAAEGDGRLSVTLKVRAGTLAVSPHAGAVDVTGNGTGLVVLTGTVAALNAALAGGVSYMGYSGFSGDDLLHIAVDDLGNAGEGGALLSSVNVAIHVRAAAEQIDDLKKTLDGFVDAGVVDGKSAKSLQSKLKSIDPSSSSAANKLGAFLNQVKALVRSRRLDEATADILAGVVTSIELSLP